MSVKPINIFDMDNYSKGGNGRHSGPGRIEKARFVDYDFGKAGGDTQVAMHLMIQPLDKNGKDVGDVKVIHYPAGKGLECCSPVKGEKGSYGSFGFAEDSEYDKVFGLGDFAIFMDHFAKTGFDMDDAGNDISALDGVAGVFEEFLKPVNTKAVPKDSGTAPAAEKKPFPLTVMVSLLDTKAKSKSKAKAEETEEKPKAKAKKAKEVGDDPEEVIEAYLDAELNDEKDGAASLGLKLGIADFAKKTLGKDQDVAKLAQTTFKENFEDLLKTRGWSLNGTKLAKGE